jgi:hypothetical protein
MKNGSTGRSALRGGLTLAAAMMMTTAAFGQDQDRSVADLPVMMVDVMPVDGGDGSPEIVIDDGFVIGDWLDDPTNDGTGDDGTGDDWVDDGTGDDGTGDDWVDDGTGDNGTGDDWVDDGTGDDGEVVIYYLDGGPILCEDCRADFGDLPMEIYQMSAGTPTADVVDAPVAAKPRRTKSHGVAAGSMAECLADHPQLPWICEWQNGSGQ